MTTTPPAGGTGRHDRVSLDALERAARFIAAFRADDNIGAARAVQEAREDNRLPEFAIATGVLSAQLADRLHGGNAQLHLDGLALDAAWFRERELALLAETGDDGA